MLIKEKLLGVGDKLKTFFQKHKGVKKAIVFGASIVGSILTGPIGAALPGILSTVIGDIQKNAPSNTYSSSDKAFEWIMNEGSKNIPDLMEKLPECAKDYLIQNEINEEIQMLIKRDPSLLGDFLDVFTQLKMQFSELAIQFDNLSASINLIKDYSRNFFIPETEEQLTGYLKLPEEIGKTLVITADRLAVHDECIKNLKEKKNVIILGEPGIGKTVLLYKLYQTMAKVSNVGIMMSSNNRTYEKEGFYLCYDDLPESESILKDITQNGLNCIFASGRIMDWNRFPDNVRKAFVQLKIPIMQELDIQAILKKHLDYRTIAYQEEAIKIIARKSEGCPMYGWQLIQDLASKQITQLSLDIAKSNPNGMIQFISDILYRLTHNGGQKRIGSEIVFLTIYLMAQYYTERKCQNDVLDNISTNIGKLGQQLNWRCEYDEGLWISFTQMLKTDPFYATALPHDSWADIIQCKIDHPIMAYFKRLRSNLDDSEIINGFKLEIEKSVFDRTIKKYNKDPRINLEKLLALGYHQLINYPMNELEEIGIKLHTYRRIAEEHRNNRLSDLLLCQLGCEIKEEFNKEQQDTPIHNFEDILMMVPEKELRDFCNWKKIAIRKGFTSMQIIKQILNSNLDASTIMEATCSLKIIQTISQSLGIKIPNDEDEKDSVIELIINKLELSLIPRQSNQETDTIKFEAKEFDSDEEETEEDEDQEEDMLEKENEQLNNNPFSDLSQAELPIYQYINDTLKGKNLSSLCYSLNTRRKTGLKDLMITSILMKVKDIDAILSPLNKEEMIRFWGKTLELDPKTSVSIIRTQIKTDFHQYILRNYIFAEFSMDLLRSIGHELNISIPRSKDEIVDLIIIQDADFDTVLNMLSEDILGNMCKLLGLEYKGTKNELIKRLMGIIEMFSHWE